ncbi:MAG: hypothetical protein DA405_11985 [Bacteroidetes bacterium]|nr:MAG: hypothetical protein DA405_11985 [Bacteroidota bacterium]
MRLDKTKFQSPEKSPLMQGVISKYFDEQGYGFIKDEKGQDYFFHFNNVLDKIEFRARVQDYIYSDLKSCCYFVQFRPWQNAKGNIALDVMLSEERLFDHSEKQCLYMVQGAKLEYKISEISFIESGIKKRQAAPLGATAGGNGTYRIGYPETYRFLSLYFKWNKFMGGGKIELLEPVLRLKGRKKVTKKFLRQLEARLKDAELEIFSDGQEWQLVAPSVLTL